MKFHCVLCVMFSLSIHQLMGIKLIQFPSYSYMISVVGYRTFLICASGTPWSYGRSMLSFLMLLHTGFHYDFISLHFHQQ